MDGEESQETAPSDVEESAPPADVTVVIEAEPAEPEAPIVPAPPSAAAPDPMAGVIARLIASYPARAGEIVKGVVAVGAPVVSRMPVAVPGGWDQKTLSTHQKYRLVDGTILPLEI